MDQWKQGYCQHSWNMLKHVETPKLKQVINGWVKWTWPRLRSFIFPTFPIFSSSGHLLHWLVSMSCPLVRTMVSYFFKAMGYGWKCDHKNPLFRGSWIHHLAICEAWYDSCIYPSWDSSFSTMLSSSGIYNYSGKRLHNYGKIHHVKLEHSLSICMAVASIANF